jgi:hypothetical protein
MERRTKRKSQPDQQLVLQLSAGAELMETLGIPEPECIRTSLGRRSDRLPPPRKSNSSSWNYISKLVYYITYFLCGNWAEFANCK